MDKSKLLGAIKALSDVAVTLDWTALVDDNMPDVGPPMVTGQPDADRLNITLRGVIGSDITAAKVQELLTALLMEQKTVRVDIASKGGDIDEASQIVALLADLPSDVSVHTRAVGVVASAATLLLAAGDKRTAVPQARIMVHGPHLGIAAVISYASVDDDFKRIKAVLEAGYGMMRATYSAAGIKAETIDGWLNSSTDVWLTPAEAKEAGLLTDDEPEQQVSAEAKMAVLAEFRARKLNGIMP